MKDGWIKSSLGELCDFENGDRGKNYPGRKALVPEGIPFINAGHIDDGKIAWNEMDFIPKDRFDILGSGKVRQGDILFCLRGSLGKFGIIDRITEGAIASSLVIVRPKEKLDPAYLAAFFRSPFSTEMVERYAGGAAQPNLSAKSLREFAIPLPPLEEQQRIVAVLDEAFEGLARARTHAEANLQNARELFEQSASQVFDKLTVGGEETTLGAVAEFRNGLNYSRTSSGQSVQVVGVGDFLKRFWIDPTSLKAVNIDGTLHTDDILQAGDILAVRSNGNKELIGRVMLMPESETELERLH